jgi:hypothetical protein
VLWKRRNGGKQNAALLFRPLLGNVKDNFPTATPSAGRGDQTKPKVGKGGLRNLQARQLYEQILGIQSPCYVGDREIQPEIIGTPEIKVRLRSSLFGPVPVAAECRHGRIHSKTPIVSSVCMQRENLGEELTYAAENRNRFSFTVRVRKPAG